MQVFEWLKNWFEANKQLLSERRVIFSFSNITKTSNPSQSVDIETKTKMARFSLWETGECDFEIIDNETAELNYFENRIINSNAELADFLQQSFLKL